MAFTIVIDYYAGIWISGAAGKRRKWILLISLISNIGILAFFKYFNFFSESLSQLFYGIGETNHFILLNIILPIGLSFHTFQAMSYTIEVYRGKVEPERHFGIYALYVMFYPQLVAGPIERPQNLLHQFREKHVFDYDRVKSGLYLMLWGMFKKVIIADRLAVFVNAVFDDPTGYSGAPMLVAVLFFTIQIYCDFSGYSDIAIGAARVMGFDLMTNFRFPYFATSLSDFWRRWHISLSTWFKDYVYIPLGGSRVGRWLNYRNLLIVFLISGLWHGASWNFVIWGAIHGVLLIVESAIRQVGVFRPNSRFSALKNCLGWGITFCIVNIAWIFFRADSLSTAQYFLQHMFDDIVHFKGFENLAVNFRGMGLKPADIWICVIGIAFLFLIDWLNRNGRWYQILESKPRAIRWTYYYVLLFILFFYANADSAQNFIYFQF
ncbi:MAG: MBOAT family O-acyltransferase [Flavobacteriales bacterium]